MIPVTHLSHWPRIRLSAISLWTAWKHTCRNVLQPSENHVKAHLDSNSPNETYCLDESELGMWNTFEMENNFGCTLLEGYTPPHFSNDLKRNSNELFKWEIQEQEHSETGIGYFSVLLSYIYQASAEGRTLGIHLLSLPCCQSFAPEWSPSQPRWNLGRTSQTLYHLLHQMIWPLYNLKAL